MKTKQKFLGVLLVIGLVLAMAPMTIFAASTHKVAIYEQGYGMGAEKYGVASNQYYLVNSEGNLNSEGADENNYNIYYDEAAGELTIHNLQINSEKSLLIPGGTIINAVGENRIECTSGGIGVVSDGDITIAGTGSLYISSSSRGGISRANKDNDDSGEYTKGGVVIQGDLALTIDHTGAASCIKTNQGDVLIGGNAVVNLNPNEGNDKDNGSITSFEGDNITIQDNAQVTSTGSFDTTGTNASGEYGKITVGGFSTLTIANEEESGVTLRGAGGIEIEKDAKLSVSSHTKSGQALVASNGNIRILGETEVNMTHSTPAGNAALYGNSIEVDGKLIVSGGTNGLYLNSGNTVKFDGAEVKITNCMIGVTAKAQITNSLMELDTTLKAFNSTTAASLTKDYEIFAGTDLNSAIFVPHEDGTVDSGVWGRQYVKIALHNCTYDQMVVSDQYKVSDATCLQPAVYYYSCICGEPGTGTFTNGEVAAHNWGTWVKNDGSDTHSRACTTENCSATETGDCTGGTATSTNKAICTVCGGEYGELKQNGNTVITVPADLTISYKKGLKLSDVDIPSAGWKWEDGNTIVMVGTNAYTIYFDTKDLEETYDFTTVKGYDSATHRVKRKINVTAERPHTDIYYALHFETNGGNEIQSRVEKSGTTIDLAEYIPVRDGHTFTDWYADEDLTEKITEVKLDQTRTIYAGWEEDGPAVDPKKDQAIYMTVAAQERDLKNGSRTTKSKVCTLKLGFAVDDPDLDLTYTTSDPEVATVEDGKITYQGVGSCVITVTAKETALCKGTSRNIEVMVGKPGTPTFTPTVTANTAEKAFVATSSTVRGVDGWEVQYSIRDDWWRATTKDFPNTGTKLYRKTCTTVHSNMTYYIRVRGYQIIDGEKVYSDWSPAKTIQTK